LLYIKQEAIIILKTKYFLLFVAVQSANSQLVWAEWNDRVRLWS